MKGSDLKLFSEALRELYAHTDAATLPHCVVRLVHRMIRADSAAYNSFDIRTRSLQVVHDHGAIGDRYLPVLNEHIERHPLMVHVRAHWREGAASLTEVISRGELRDSAIYAEFFRPLGIEEQLGILVEDAEYGAAAVSVQRQDRAFSEREKKLMTLLQPHLIQVFKNAADLTALRAENAGLKQAVDVSRLGVVWVRGNGQIEWMSSRARTWIAEYFLTGGSGLGERLPPPLMKWMQRRAGAMISGNREALFTGSRGELGVRWLADGADRVCLILSERKGAHAADDLRSLGLSTRETEVLHWVAEGKSNEDVGRILAMSKRTVEKHLQNVFAKLGVETRTAAVLRAAECRRLLF